jgi:hypothetical protein
MVDLRAIGVLAHEDMMSMETEDVKSIRITICFGTGGKDLFEKLL